MRMSALVCYKRMLQSNAQRIESTIMCGLQVYELKLLHVISALAINCASGRFSSNLRMYLIRFVDVLQNALAVSTCSSSLM